MRRRNDLKTCFSNWCFYTYVVKVYNYWTISIWTPSTCSENSQGMVPKLFQNKNANLFPDRLTFLRNIYQWTCICSHAMPAITKIQFRCSIYDHVRNYGHLVMKKNVDMDFRKIDISNGFVISRVQLSKSQLPPLKVFLHVFIEQKHQLKIYPINLELTYQDYQKWTKWIWCLWPLKDEGLHIQFLAFRRC